MRSILVGVLGAAFALSMVDRIQAHGPGGPPPGRRGGTTEPPPPPPPPPTPGPGDVTGPTTPGAAGPTTPGPRAPSTGGPKAPTGPVPAPATGGPPRRPTGNGPTTGRGIPLGPDLSRWQYWWAHNREPYLRREGPAAGGPLTGSDGFFTGASARGIVPVPRATAGRLALPVLERLLAAPESTQTLLAALHAVARIGQASAGADVVGLIRPHLGNDQQLVRENVVLALGIAQREAATSDLVELLRDSAAGRGLVRRERVSDRTRAFAAYALGLVGRRAPASVRQQLVDELGGLLREPSTTHRDLKVAAVSGLRLLGGDDATGAAGKRVRWTAATALMDYYWKDLGRTEQLLQAHIAPAVAALLGRGSSLDHELAKQAFLADLSDKGRATEIVQSAAIALGSMAQPAEVEAGDAVYSRALERYSAHGKDQQACYFALLSLGQIGGTHNRAVLLKTLQRGQSLERSWAALALGVLAHDARKANPQVTDVTIGRALQQFLRNNKNDEVRAAAALGLGLAGYAESAPELRAMLRRYGKRAGLGGYVCLALALLEDKTAGPEVRGVLEQADRRPGLLGRAGVALAMLGDREGNAELLEVVGSSTHNASVLGAAAVALGFGSDAGNAHAVLALLRRDGLTESSRSNLVDALGRMADKDWLPWHALYAVNCNYRAAVPTLTDQAYGILDKQ